LKSEAKLWVFVAATKRSTSLSARDTPPDEDEDEDQTDDQADDVPSVQSFQATISLEETVGLRGPL